jgi:hypothetical protein
VSAYAQVSHRENIPWNLAPLPFRWHRCSAWTTGRIFSVGKGYVTVRRCACGAAFIGGKWEKKNSRRRNR